MDGKKISLGLLAVFIVALFAIAMYTDSVSAYTGQVYMFSPTVEDNEANNATKIVHFFAKTKAEDGTVYIIAGRIRVAPVEMDDSSNHYEIVGGKIAYKIVGSEDSIVILDDVSGSAVVDEYGFVNGEFTAVNEDGNTVYIVFTGAQFRKPRKMSGDVNETRENAPGPEAIGGMGNHFQEHGGLQLKAKAFKKVRALGSISISATLDGVSTLGYGIFAVNCGH